MRRLFFRIYLSILLGVGLLFGGVAFLVVDTLLPHRNRQLEAQLGGALSEIAQEVNGLSKSERVAALQHHAAHTGPVLAILSEELAPLDKQDRSRLLAGETVVLGSELGRFAYAQLPGEPLVLEMELYGVRSAALQWALPALAAGEGEPLTEALGPLDEARLRYRAIALRGAPWSDRRIVVRDDRGTRVVTGAPGPHALPLIALALGVLLTGVAVFWPLRGLRRDLVRLSDTVGEVEAGDLSARADLSADGGPVSELAAQFDGMTARVERLIQSHEALLHAVAHELRTPLSRLYFAIDLFAASNEAERAELQQDIELALEVLEGLTDELLTYSRLAEGAPPTIRETIDITELLSARTFARYEPERDIDVRSATIAGDRVLLTRLLDNLLRNATRYAQRVTRMTARLEAGGAWVEILIEDDGPGIAESDRERVFEPFVRLDDSRSRDSGGIGLGLAIAQRIAKHHGGELTVCESPLGGARFRLTLPLHDEGAYVR